MQLTWVFLLEISFFKDLNTMTHFSGLFISRILVGVVMLFGLTACTNVPSGITPVQDFDKARYLGTWYEIARLDHPFERGLEQISATYTLRDDGGIDVLNQGLEVATGEISQANGKAYFVADERVGHLKVSFFGPFYASYVIAQLDDNYQYALVTGPDTDYLWILSREKTLGPEITNKLLAFAEQKGFDTQSMIYVKHN